MPLRPNTPDSASQSRSEQGRLYDEVVASFGSALERLAVGYERHVDRRKDLLQDIHFALWRSLASFDGRCALRTWVYRVAHNVATSHAIRDHRRARGQVPLNALDVDRTVGAEDTLAARVDERLDTERQRAQLTELIAQLVAQDRQIVLLYLEELDAAAIGEVTGLSPSNVATKIHRIKRILASTMLAKRPAAQTPTPSSATHIAELSPSTTRIP